MIFHVHEVENFNWRTLRYFMSTKWESFSWGTLVYFMSTKWKCVTREIYNISCSQSGKLQLGYSKLFMSTQRKSLTGELCDISFLRGGKGQLENSAIFPVHEVEKFDRRTPRYFMPTKWKRSYGELYNISCPQSGKV